MLAAGKTVRQVIATLQLSIPRIEWVEIKRSGCVPQPQEASSVPRDAEEGKMEIAASTFACWVLTMELCSSYSSAKAKWRQELRGKAKDYPRSIDERKRKSQF